MKARITQDQKKCFHCVFHDERRSLCVIDKSIKPQFSSPCSDFVWRYPPTNFGYCSVCEGDGKCPTCSGTGSPACPVCSGSGTQTAVIHRISPKYGTVFSSAGLAGCPACYGSGNLTNVGSTDAVKCRVCGGNSVCFYCNSPSHPSLYYGINRPT